jgi:nucleoside-diphosphate-sugar epimerase
MKVLVTGGTGFIGSHLIDRLLEENHEVFCVVRRSSNRTWLTGKPLQLLECDRVCSPEFIRGAVRGVEIVIHGMGVLAASNLEAFREVNVRPVRLFLEACRNQGGVKRFVLLGSHGAAGPNPAGKERITETDPCHPVSAYGRSKLEAEDVTREYLGQVPWTILRLSAVYGPRDHSFRRIFRSAYHRGVVPQVGRQPKSLSLAHVRDIVAGITLASTSERSVNETYFLSTEQPCSFEDVRAGLESAMHRVVKLRVIPNLMVQGLMLWSDFLARVFGQNVLLNRDRLATLAYPRWVCDVSKAREQLGYRQTVSLNDGLRETFEWYRQTGWL